MRQLSDSGRLFAGADNEAMGRENNGCENEEEKYVLTGKILTVLPGGSLFLGTS